MEKEIFPTEEVARFYNATFVSYKINFEDQAEGEALAKKYGITGFPTYVYLDKDGELLHQSGGGKSAADFIADAQNAFDPDKALFSLKRRYDTGERSAAFLFHYSNALAQFHQTDSPEETVVAQYLATQTPAQLASEENLHFIFSRYLGFRSSATQYFLRHQGQFLPLFKEEVKHKAQRIITQTAQMAGTENDLVLLQEVQQAVASNFRDAERLNALAMIYFYAGRKDWRRYAQETLAYSKTLAGDDWRTLYETGMYLNAFAKDKEAMEIGTQLMKRAVALHRNPENLYLYARLQHKAGREAKATKAAKEALDLAKSTGEDTSDISAFLTELKSGS